MAVRSSNIVAARGEMIRVVTNELGRTFSADKVCPVPQLLPMRSERLSDRGVWTR